MSIESAADWDGLRRVAHVVRLTLDALEAAVRPGTTTGALDDVAKAVFARHGAASAPARTYGFPGTVLISVNDEVVHGVPGRRRIEEGDLVKLDVTAELDGYIADAARTVIAGEPREAARTGRPNDARTARAQTGRDLRDCAVAAFVRALRVARAGHRVNEVGREVEREVHARGFRVADGLEGHGVGRAIHEPPRVPNRYDPGQTDVLTDGMVLTIEPIVTAGSADVTLARDGWTIRTTDGSRSAHHEHTIVITAGDPIVLTGTSPAARRSGAQPGTAC
jgi:methionyl aminopeptidase